MNAWQKNNRDKVRANQRAWYARNAERSRAEWREWYAANRDRELERGRLKRLRLPEQTKSAWMKATHGISLDEKRQLFESQNGRCAIGVACCGLGISFDRIVIDHCHKAAARIPKPDGTAVRGLVCQACNQLLGVLGDSIGEIRKFRDKLDEFERYLTETHPLTQQRLAEIRSRKS